MINYDPDSQEADIDLAAIKMIQAIGEDGHLLREMIQLFLSGAERFLHRQKTIFQREDFQAICATYATCTICPTHSTCASGALELASVAHTLKSSSLCVGARRIAAICSMLETCPKQGIIKKIAELIEEFHLELKRVKQFFKQYT